MMKIIDRPWMTLTSLTTSTVGYLSDSWASCLSSDILCTLRLSHGIELLLHYYYYYTQAVYLIGLV